MEYIHNNIAINKAGHNKAIPVHKNGNDRATFQPPNGLNIVSESNALWNYISNKVYTPEEKAQCSLPDFQSIEEDYYRNNFAVHIKSIKNTFAFYMTYWETKPRDLVLSTTGIIPRENLIEIIKLFVAEIEKDSIKNGIQHAYILNWAIHYDEKVQPHIHIRGVWQGVGKDKLLKASQALALSFMGFTLPFNKGHFDRYRAYLSTKLVAIEQKVMNRLNRQTKLKNLEQRLSEIDSSLKEYRNYISSLESQRKLIHAQYNKLSKLR